MPLVPFLMLISTIFTFTFMLLLIFHFGFMNVHPEIVSCVFALGFLAIWAQAWFTISKYVSQGILVEEDKGEPEAVNQNTQM